MHQVKIIGGTVTKFGKHMDRNMKSLAAEAVNGALESAGIEKEQLQGAWVGNAAQGIIEGQECIRGQVVLRDMGIGGIPVRLNTPSERQSRASSRSPWSTLILTAVCPS